MLIWPYAPDWTDEVRVTYSFKTEVITSRSNKEQRIADRDRPRLGLEYTAFMADRDFRVAMGILAMRAGEQVKMPVWSRPVPLLGPVDAAATGFTLAGEDSLLAASTEVIVIWGSPENTQFITETLLIVVGDEVTTVGAMGLDIPDGAVAYPLATGRLTVDTSIKLANDAMARASVRFDIDPGFEVLMDAGEALEMHDGREVLMIPPDWAKDITLTMRAFRDTLDYGFGRTYHYSPTDINERMQSLGYIGAERAEVDVLTNFFRRHRGQQVEFFMPTFTSDMIVHGSRDLGDVVLRVSGHDIYDIYRNHTVYKNLVIFYTDGTHEIYAADLINKVTDSTGLYSRIAIEPPMRRDFSISDVQMICWLPLWRFTQDDLTEQWVTDEIANVGLSVKTLETLDAETFDVVLPL